MHLKLAVHRCNEEALRETQTLRAGCSKKNFRPAADPLSGGAGRPKFN